MIKSNPDHKKAVLKNIKNTSKIGLVTGLIGLIGVSSVVLYSGFEEKDIDIDTDVSGYSTSIYDGFDIIKGDAEREIYDDLYKDYEEFLEKKQSENFSKDYTYDKKELVYDETLKESDIVEIDNKYNKKKVLLALGRYDELDDENATITVEDLRKIEKLSFYNIEINDGDDISWLNYCTNLKYLDIEIEDEKGFECLNQITELINLYKFDINVSPHYKGKAVSINDDYFSFLRNSPNLRGLTVDSTSFALDDDFLNEIGNKDYGYNIEIKNFYAGSQKIDPTKLKNCKEIIIYPEAGTGIYDIATVFSREQFDELIKSGINIEINNKDGIIEQDEIIKKVNTVYDQIDNVIAKIDITEDMSETERLNKVLEYVLNDLTYSETISQKLTEENKKNRGKIVINGRF